METVVIPIIQILFDGKTKLPLIGKDILSRHSVLIARMKFSIREFIIGVNGGCFFISIPIDWKIMSKLEGIVLLFHMQL